MNDSARAWQLVARGFLSAGRPIYQGQLVCFKRTRLEIGRPWRVFTRVVAPSLISVSQSRSRGRRSLWVLLARIRRFPLWGRLTCSNRLLTDNGIRQPNSWQAIASHGAVLETRCRSRVLSPLLE